MSANTDTSVYASSDTNSSQGDESPNHSNLSGLEDKGKRLSRENPEQNDARKSKLVTKAPSVREVISHLHANSGNISDSFLLMRRKETKASNFNDWQDMEKSIMSANISSVRAKWLEREKGMLEKEKQARPVAVLNDKKKQFLSAALAKNDEEDEKDEKEKAPAKVGNVFLFLQQKQKEVREEQVVEAKVLHTNLPPAPPIPIIAEPPKPIPKETPASPTSQRKKQDSKKEKKEKKEKEKKEKKDKKDKKDKKQKEEKKEEKTVQRLSSETDPLGLKQSGVHEKPPKEPYVLYDYVASDSRMISLTKGKQVIIVDKSFSTDWVHIECDGKSGLFPLNYIKMPSTGPKGFLEFLEESDEEEDKKKKELSLQEGGIAALVMPTSPSQSRQTSLQNTNMDEDEDMDVNLDPRVHLFEQPDGENNIIYKDDEQNASGLMVVRGATLEKLIHRLTHEQIPDPEFVSSFLLTYSAITNPNELLDLLILRYRTPKPKDMDKEVFKNKKRTPIRLRVVNVLKLWIKKDFVTIRESNVLPKMKDFISKLMGKTLPSASKELMTLIATKEDEKSNVPEIFVNKKPPKPIIPKKTTDLTLNDIHPEEVARQLTLIEHDLFKNIQSHECIKQKWLKDSKNLTPNIHRIINRFNSVSNWVASEIVQVEDLKLRAVTLNRFIFIAQKCFELNNFNAVMEILSALNCSAVHRLRQTWDLLPPKSIEVFEDLEVLMNAEGNFAAYRDSLKKAKPPVIPYLGLTLTDLVFISEGNPDIVPNSTLINWWKLNLIASVIKEMQQYQETPFTLEKVDVVQEFLLSRPNMTEDDMYKLSLQREERTKKKRATKDSE